MKPLEIPAELRRRAARIRLVLMDVDGVLTDGLLHVGADGAAGHAFHVRDGLGIRLGQRAGLQFGIISAREALAVAGRAAELDIEEVHQGVRDKLERMHDILDRLGVEADEVCFIGDDLTDVPAMRRAGLAAAPADAAPEVLALAHFVGERPGGRGCVRETVELVLRATDRWERAVEPWMA